MPSHSEEPAASARKVDKSLSEVNDLTSDLDSDSDFEDQYDLVPEVEPVDPADYASMPELELQEYEEENGKFGIYFLNFVEKDTNHLFLGSFFSETIVNLTKINKICIGGLQVNSNSILNFSNF